MYNLLIVDDEPAIRQGIANGIPWSEWGFSVCGVCGDGEEALALVPTLKPDVVLSDIRMPKMDGVELMQRLNAEHPGIKILILSGYSDFEYLNMSIKNQVTEYLLKPTDVDEFKDVFMRLRRRLDDERALDRQYAQSVNRHFLEWVEALIKGMAEAEDTGRFFPVLKARGLDTENMLVVVLTVDERAGDEEHSLQDLKRRIVRHLESRRSLFSALYLLGGDGNIVGLYSSCEEEPLSADCLLREVQEVQSEVKEREGATLSAGISNLCSETDMLPQAFEQANCCANQNLFGGPQSIFKFSELLTERPHNIAYFDTAVIQTGLLMLDYEPVAAEIERVFGSFSVGPVREYMFADRMCLSLLFHVSLWGLQYNLYMEDVLRGLGTTYTDIYRCDTLEKKKQFLLAVMYAVCRALDNKRVKGRHTNSVANRVKEFVDKEYCRNEMSLEYVAEHVSKNSAYVSRVFKNELGANFSDYITEKRIKMAQSLLSDPAKKVYEVAEECGYADTSNFIKVFKRTTGISPNEYRRASGGF